MSRQAKKGGVDKHLKVAIAKCLKQVMADDKATMTDKCKVIDRALKLAAIESKVDDAGYGTGFGAGDPGSDDDDAD